MQCTKGIILAGGLGTRLYPLTIASNKQLLPIYDKPVIYYSLTTLMLAGIRDILIISSPYDLPALKGLFGSGKHLGLRLSYKVQDTPKGLPEAFMIGEEFINQEPVAMVLGDNFFHAQNLTSVLQGVAKDCYNAHVFTCSVEDPSRYGVVILDGEGKIADLVEKPAQALSNLVLTGLYFFPGDVASKAKTLTPSKRGELEITELIKLYLKENKLSNTPLGRGTVWFDVGTPQALLNASSYVEVIQTRQGINIASPEEVAWRMGFISGKEFTSLVEDLPECSYTLKLRSIVDAIITSKGEAYTCQKLQSSQS